MELLMIKRKTSKDQENPLGIITEDRKSEIDHGHDTNDCRQLRNQIEEVVKLGQLSHLVKGIKKERDESYTKNSALEGFIPESREITFPSRGSNSSAPSIQDRFEGPFNQIFRGNLGLPYNMLLGRTSMQKMGILVSTIHGAIKFHTTKGIGIVFSTYESNTVKEGMKKARETPPASEKWVFSCVVAKEKGYHHIQMAEGDEDKTAFFAGEGVFCYQKMPFGLKNAGATYQRLVDKVFHDQIRRKLEAYVDDMVIKSTSKE
ncbi:reverse transcriptase domain-containing protein [Tanacetum coccineum]|uniref:Reverse transcriptase domain-containing protein n=1 Tax=Tanacetum coccineum TaxID=301880 RepID=A0ABQ5J0B3_9ASTR